jgi:hypothetical protein
VKHLVHLKRQSGIFFLALMLAIGIGAPQAVGASNPTPINPICFQCLNDAAPPYIFYVTALQHPITYGVPYVAVEVAVSEGTTSVNLSMPGNVTLVSVCNAGDPCDGYGDHTFYEYHVTGLTPHQTYNYTAVAHSALSTYTRSGSLTA